MSETNGQLRLDIRTLKIHELRAIEKAVGHKIAQEIATFDFGMDTIQGLLWIALRRQRPEATFDDAADLSFEDIIHGISGPEEMPPSPMAPLEPDGNAQPSSGENGSASRPPSSEPTPSSASTTA